MAAFILSKPHTWIGKAIPACTLRGLGYEEKWNLRMRANANGTLVVPRYHEAEQRMCFLQHVLELQTIPSFRRCEAVQDIIAIRYVLCCTTFQKWKLKIRLWIFDTLLPGAEWSRLV